MTGLITESDTQVDAVPDEESDVDSLKAAHRQAYARCIRWLGQRDHSSTELSRKLSARDVGQSVIDEVIRELRESRYVDDERFASTLAEQRSRRGYGPRYIRSKLTERGIDRSQTDIALESLGIDWQLVAGEALRGRFRDEQLADDSQRQQAKLARFLEARGFSAGDSLRAIREARAVVAADPAGCDRSSH